MTYEHPYPYPQPGPPPKRSKVGLWIGILIGALMPFVGFGALWLVPGGDFAGIAGLVLWGGTIVAGIVLLFFEQARWWGVGILIGFFGALIIGAGACIALIALVIGSQGTV